MVIQILSHHQKKDCIWKMSSLLEAPSSSKTSSSQLKMSALSNDQLKIGQIANDQNLKIGHSTSNNCQMSNGQGPIEQSSNGERPGGHGKGGQRSSGRDESEARYCEFTRQSILSDPRCFDVDVDADAGELVKLVMCVYSGPPKIKIINFMKCATFN